MRRSLIALALLAGFSLAGAARADAPPAPGSATWFGIHYIDTSTEGAINGVRADETARIEMIEDYIAAALTERGFDLRSPEPERIARIRNPVHSNGADSKIAAEMGTDYAISGEVQKVSNLIQSVNLYIREAGTGRQLRAGAVDVRGNTDEAYQRGYSYLLRNIIFRED
jgi:hypothetical protein